MQISELLLKIGLSNIQCKVYLYVLCNPGLSILSMSKSMNLNRTTLYTVLSSLVEKGLVTSNVQLKSTTWYPIDLDSFFDGYYCDLKVLHKNLFNMYLNAPKLPKFDLVNSRTKNNIKIMKIRSQDTSTTKLLVSANFSSPFCSAFKMYNFEDIVYSKLVGLDLKYEFYISELYTIVSDENFENCLYINDPAVCEFFRGYFEKSVDSN